MSRSRRGSIFSPGNPGMATKRPPWTVLHRCRESLVLRISADDGVGSSATTPIVRRARRQRIRSGDFLAPATTFAIGPLRRRLDCGIDFRGQHSDKGGVMAEAGAPDLAAITRVQQQIWSQGDFSKIGVSGQIVAEELCEAVDLLPGERVL